MSAFPAPAAGQCLQPRPHPTDAGPADSALAGRLSRSPDPELRGDAGFALPLLYDFCEFFGLQYAFGIPANAVFQRRAEPLQKHLQRRYRRTQLPQRGFSSFRHRARSWPHQRRICYKAEHTTAGTNLRFVITNCPGRASEV